MITMVLARSFRFFEHFNIYELNLYIIKNNNIILIYKIIKSTENGGSWVGCLFLCFIVDMIALDYALTRLIYYLLMKIKSPECVFYIMSIRGFLLQLDEVVI